MVYAADAGDRFIPMYGHLETYADGRALHGGLGTPVNPYPLLTRKNRRA